MSTSHAAGWGSDAPTPAQLKELFDQIGRGQMTRRKLQRALGNILCLRVDGSNPRWQTICKEDYYHVESSLSVADFPITNLGIREVEYDVVTFCFDSNPRMILEKLNEPGYRRPERDETETYLDNVLDSEADLRNSPIIGLCGLTSEDGVAFIYANHRGRGIHRYRSCTLMDCKSRFLRVRITK